MDGLYKRIKARREELGYSQEDLAKKLGYKSRSTIAKIESGENDIPQSKIKAFADALETTPTYLMGWDSENEDDEYSAKLREFKNNLIKDIGETEFKHLSASIDVESYATMLNMKLMKGITNSDLPLTFFINYLLTAFPKLADVNMLSNISDIKELYSDVKNYTEFALKKYMIKKAPEHLILKAANKIEGATEEDDKHDDDIMNDPNF